jgi:hypothetical protein
VRQFLLWYSGRFGRHGHEGDPLGRLILLLMLVVILTGDPPQKLLLLLLLIVILVADHRGR